MEADAVAFPKQDAARQGRLIAFIDESVRTSLLARGIPREGFTRDERPRRRQNGAIQRSVESRMCDQTARSSNRCGDTRGCLIVVT